MRAAGIVNVADARRAARRILPQVVFDYIDGGADDEITLRANEAAFAARTFRPRVGVDSSTPELATTVLGTPISMPVMLAPCGLVSIIHPSAGPGAARAASSRGTLSLLSTGAGSPVEEVVAAAPGAVWFQLYAFGGHADVERLVGRTEAAGIEVLVVTVDTVAVGNRERDKRHGVGPPLHFYPRNVLHLGPQVLARPLWSWRMAGEGVRMVRRAGTRAPRMHDPFVISPSTFTWRDIEGLRRRWAGKLVIKGLLVGDDARIAVETGADAVVVSNHGGRQLESAIASIAVLPEIVDAVGDQAEVILDGGVRRGNHVVKAVALGARAVLIGRPYLWGLAVAGQQGVERVLDIFHSEISTTMALLGCTAVSELDSDWVR